MDSDRENLFKERERGGGEMSLSSVQPVSGSISVDRSRMEEHGPGVHLNKGPIRRSWTSK